MEIRFIECYFHSVDQLLDIRYSEERNINSLNIYLENLHSLADKLKKQFGKNIRSFPDFKLLQLLRNYAHHEEDINEFRYFVNLQHGIYGSHIEQIIIPLEFFAKSIKSFIDKNTVPKNNPKYESKLDFMSNELLEVFKCCDYQFLLENLLFYCDKPKFDSSAISPLFGYPFPQERDL